MGILEGLREIVRGMERRSLGTLKHCPKCGSSRLRLSSRFDLWLTPEQYVCERCGYKGPIVMELEEEKNSLEMS